MRLTTIFLMLIFCGYHQTNAQRTVMLDSTELAVDTVIGGLDVPWEIVWGPDDHIWFTERHGKISRLNPQTGVRKVLLDYRSKVYQFNEAGMLGLFLHPDFATKPLVYVAYTYLQSSVVKERISRFTYQNDSLVNEEILIDNIPGNSTHDGCRFLLMSDRTVLITTGDARKDADAQKVEVLNGKILRMTLDGGIPADNPNAQSYVWAWGLRNTQGLAMGAHSIIYSSEHGPTSDDELNILTKGRNFGWPNVEGKCNSAPELQFCKDSNVVEPIYTWTPTIAPSDLIYFYHPSIPEFQHALVMTVLKNKMLAVFKLSPDGQKVESYQTYLAQEFGRLRDICTDGNGNIYLATNGNSWSNSDPNTHVIIRLRNERFVGVPTTKSLTGCSLFPNPSGNEFTLRFPKSVTDGAVRIYRASGELVDGFELSVADGNQYRYENKLLSNGLYFIVFQSGNLTQTMKWVLQSN